jgi:hypothetical protein
MSCIPGLILFARFSQILFDVENRLLFENGKFDKEAVYSGQMSIDIEAIAA